MDIKKRLIKNHGQGLKNLAGTALSIEECNAIIGNAVNRALTLGGISYCTTCKEKRLQEFNKEMEELRQKYKNVLN